MQDDSLIRLITRSQEETKQGLRDLRTHTHSIADAMTQLTTAVARMEERHIRVEEIHEAHAEGMKRLHIRIDNVEARGDKLGERINSLESSRERVKGGWMFAAKVAGVTGFLIGLALSAINALKG